MVQVRQPALMEQSLNNSFVVMIKLPSRKSMQAVTESDRVLRSIMSGVMRVKKMLTVQKTYTAGNLLVWTLQLIAHGIQVSHANRLINIQTASSIFGLKEVGLRGRKKWTGLSQGNAPNRAPRHIYNYKRT